jgi:AcrR family transcriptional regulator
MAKASRATGIGDADEARRKEILDAAFRVFAEKGFNGATMLAIARRAKASKETLYAWFGNKDRLFDTLLRARLESLAQGATLDAVPEDADMHARLAAFARRQLRAFTHPEYIALFRIFTSEAPRSAALRRIIRDMLARQGLATALADYRARGWLDYDAEPEQVAAIFLRMIESNWVGLLFYKIVDHVSESAIAAHADLVARIFLDGLAPAARAEARRRTR